MNLPLCIAFNWTSAQILDGTKTVTRRVSPWLFEQLRRPVWNASTDGNRLGDWPRVIAVRGREASPFARLDVFSVRRERLDLLTLDDVDREGFPGRSREWFLGLYCREFRCYPSSVVSVIEFRLAERLVPWTPSLFS